MKQWEKIIHIIHGWPEEARRLLAVFVMVAVIVVVFNVFTRGLSSRLTALSLGDNVRPAHIADQRRPDADLRGNTETPRVLSPAAGLGESFKSLEEFVKGVSLPRVSLPTKDAFEKQAGDVLRSLAGIWSGVMDTIWRLVYIP